MPVASSMEELHQMLLKEMKKAIQVVQKKVEADMYEETGLFYAGGDPDRYKRTGALGDTPRTTACSNSGDSVSFEAYLDQSHGYSTGSNPSMGQVLDLANYGIPFETPNGVARPTVGSPGFWERAEKKMGETLDDTMGQFFE